MNKLRYILLFTALGILCSISYAQNRGNTKYHNTPGPLQDLEALLINTGINIGQIRVNDASLAVRIAAFEKTTNSDSLVALYYHLARRNDLRKRDYQAPALKCLNALHQTGGVKDDEQLLLIGQKILGETKAGQSEAFFIYHYLRARMLYATSDYESSLGIIQQRVRELERMEPEFDSLLILYYSLGFANQYLLGAINEAKEFIMKGIALYTSSFGAEESYQLASLHNNIGIVERKLGNYDIALQNYLRAIEIKERLNVEDPDKLLTSAISLANLYNILGRYDEGLKLINDYESVYYSGLNPSTQVSICVLKSRLYRNLKDKDKAIQYINLAKKTVNYISKKQSKYLAEIFLAEGNIYASFEHSQEAITA
ncbi:MAG: tetratricopeptide repeat protein, partial [Bacteroidales bacterium]|nr:tetratricopeptide repeat protein [Bacteroidales bacterium]